MKMSKDERIAWDECLRLWEAIVKFPERVTYYQEDYKNNILKSIGIDKRENGCPMCDRFIRREMSACPRCPISIENNNEYGACENDVGYDRDNPDGCGEYDDTPLTPYGYWRSAYPDISGHSENFLEYLKALAKKRGYYE